MCIHRISTVGYRVVNVNGACNRSDTDGCSRRMPLCILVVSSVPRSYTTYVGDTGTVRKLITCLLRRHAPSAEDMLMSYDSFVLPRCRAKPRHRSTCHLT